MLQMGPVLVKAIDETNVWTNADANANANAARVWASSNQAWASKQAMGMGQQQP